MFIFSLLNTIFDLGHQPNNISIYLIYYFFQQSNSVYDSTLFEAGGTTPMNPVYSASLQSPDSIASGQSLEIGEPPSAFKTQHMPPT